MYIEQVFGRFITGGQGGAGAREQQEGQLLYREPARDGGGALVRRRSKIDSPCGDAGLVAFGGFSWARLCTRPPNGKPFLLSPVRVKIRNYAVLAGKCNIGLLLVR